MPNRNRRLRSKLYILLSAAICNTSSSQVGFKFPNQ